MRKFPAPNEIKQLPTDGGDQYNRLVFESSPYLRQHASNPVDWYPWGDEAFAKARSENKPIFLSIGYSTCHWCHVMEHESFESREVAEYMGRKFVAIKLDREERPDLDHQYMAVTQAMQGHGGWPNSLFLTPNAEPFFAFTYLPKDQFMGVLSQVSELWETQMEQVAGRAVDISRIVGGSLQAIRGGGVLDGVIERACEQLHASADMENGGFGHAPKFPHADDLILLTRCCDDDAFVGLTLTKMRQGGIYDQLAGGFHRYSTDEKWLLPHFEKMLYDQASLLNAYCTAYARYGSPMFKETTLEICKFVDAELSSERGAFFGAIDADSEGEEGKSYVWNEAEIEKLLGDDAVRAKAIYGTSPEGNFLDERTRERTGINVLTLTSEKDDPMIRKKLLDVRNTRIQPMVDDKILTDWNGMMIASMARASVALGEPRLAERAARSATSMLQSAGEKLTHTKGGKAAFLDDYAFLINGLVELNQADFNQSWLTQATNLADEMLEYFEDKSIGGFFMTRDALEGTDARPKVAMDSAYRSGYAAATLGLIRLGRVLQIPKYIESGKKAIEAASGDIESMPTGHTGLLLAFHELESGSEVVVVAESREAAIKSINDLSKGDNNAVFIPVYPDADAPEFAKSLSTSDGQTTYYVCRSFACELPTTEIDQARERL